MVFRRAALRQTSSSLAGMLALGREGLLPLALLAAGCCASRPPPSQFPNADAALARMHATAECGNGILAKNAKLDHFGARGRVRGDMSMFVVRPARLRMSVFSPPPLMSPIVTLTSDGAEFRLADMRENKFFVGPATACNIARLTTVPIPGPVLVELLRGQAPVLKHTALGTSIAWSSKGYYVVRIAGTRDAHEEIHLLPHRDDWYKPYTEQRMRVLDVVVDQYGDVLYHAEMEDHEPVPMAQPLFDPEGIDPTVLPSGPVCDAEVPRKIHVEVPEQDDDVQFKYTDITWNPPIPEGTFTQPAPPGMAVVPVRCED
jgi:hypothetical protein